MLIHNEKYVLQLIIDIKSINILCMMYNVEANIKNLPRGNRFNVLQNKIINT